MISEIILLTCPELPKQFSTIEMRRAFASLFTEKHRRHDYTFARINENITDIKQIEHRK